MQRGYLQGTGREITYVPHKTQLRHHTLHALEDQMLTAPIWTATTTYRRSLFHFAFLIRVAACHCAFFEICFADMQLAFHISVGHVVFRAKGLCSEKFNAQVDRDSFRLHLRCVGGEITLWLQNVAAGCFKLCAIDHRSCVEALEIDRRLKRISSSCE